MTGGSIARRAVACSVGVAVEILLSLPWLLLLLLLPLLEVAVQALLRKP